ncbi:hypothetical protein BGZ97_000170 [Linnemannia gamsii]|jgi:hypothetical protein|uniref:Uncharacterized protein n=1 Tax=Linnemannia gamsii TaxID=64522 RepID=A0A9P6R1I4_9FUNG|nr:hypothetical protein BGZ97_000170 [Linnemannia gamsii]
MVQLTLPLLDNIDNESGDPNQPNCDPSQSIYDNKSCIKDFLFCSDDNPCPSKIPCVDRVCQCEPNTQSYITLMPNPVRMYTLGCNFDKKRESDSCRDYEYLVGKTCLLNYCSSAVPCYAGKCDGKRNVCTNITASAARLPLPVNNNHIISLGEDPFGTQKEGLSPVLIILFAAGAVVALALIGCIVRTATQWTKSSVAWASDSHKSGSAAGGDDDENGDEKTYNNSRSMPSVKEVSNASSNQSDSSIMRKPSKFTGSHYMPEHAVQSSSALSEISPFGTPVPSPHFSPYSHPDHGQGSDMSLSNPFRHRIDDSRISMDLLSSGSVVKDHHPLSELSSSPEQGSIDKIDSSAPFSGPTPVPAHGAPSSSLSPPLGQDLRISRSQTFSRNPSSNLSAVNHTNPHQTEIRSAPLPIVGSRSPPPPPTMYSDRIVPPMMAYSQNRLSSATVMGPSMSLDSLMDYSSGNHQHHQRDSVVLNDSPHSSRPNSPALRPSSSVGSPLVIQSGAERLPALTVPHKQSMLRHSASVPQLVDPSSPLQRNLPAGFASNPVTTTVKRY